MYGRVLTTRGNWGFSSQGPSGNGVVSQLGDKELGIIHQPHRSLFEGYFWEFSLPSTLTATEKTQAKGVQLQRNNGCA